MSNPLLLVAARPAAANGDRRFRAATREQPRSFRPNFLGMVCFLSPSVVYFYSALDSPKSDGTAELRVA